MSDNRLATWGRQSVAYGAVTVVALILVAGLVNLQIVDHAELYEKSEMNRVRVVPIVPRRGMMYDREERVLVDNRPSYTVSVVPSEEVKGKTLANLARVIDIDTGQIRKIMKRTMLTRYLPASIKPDIPFDVVAVLEERNNEFPGVSYSMEKVRQYQHSAGMESFTGYVGEVSPQDLERNPDIQYRLGSLIGKKGLEKQYDNRLRGIEGTAYVEVYASGQVVGPYGGKEKVEAMPGTDLHLSIDLDIQTVVDSIFDTTHCCGAIVAIDPRTGEVLAMASRPGFDPNVFSAFVPENLWQSISQDPTHPLLNRPLNGLYPPGSTAKLLTVGAGLEEGVIDENTTFRSCIGGYQFGNRFFRCWEPKGHGVVTAVHGIEASCDVYMYQLGLKLGVEGLAKYYDACGFGKPTGVDLPGESKGLNPTPEYLDKVYGKRGWTKALALNLAIGQGEILVTPIQLAQFYCGLANNGVVYRPHLVRAFVKPDGTREEVKPEVSFKLPFSPHTLSVLKEGLRLVVEGGRGTARRLKNKYYSIGGKTGTAQNPHGDNHAWFVGVAPLENSEIVVAAIVENAGHGSEVAAPAVGKIIKAYMFKKLGIIEEPPKPVAKPSDSTAVKKPAKPTSTEASLPVRPTGGGTE